MLTPLQDYSPGLRVAAAVRRDASTSTGSVRPAPVSACRRPVNRAISYFGSEESQLGVVRLRIGVIWQAHDLRIPEVVQLRIMIAAAHFPR